MEKALQTGWSALGFSPVRTALARAATGHKAWCAERCRMVFVGSLADHEINRAGGVNHLGACQIISTVISYLRCIKVCAGAIISTVAVKKFNLQVMSASPPIPGEGERIGFPRSIIGGNRGRPSNLITIELDNKLGVFCPLAFTQHQAKLIWRYSCGVRCWCGCR